MELFVPILMGALTVLTAVAYWHPIQYQRLVLPVLVTIGLLMLGAGMGWQAAVARAALAAAQAKADVATTIAISNDISNLDVPGWAALTFFCVVGYLSLLGLLKPLGLTAHDRNQKSGA